MYPSICKEMDERLKECGKVGISEQLISIRDAVSYAITNRLWLKIELTSYEFKKEEEKGYYYPIKQELDKNGLLSCPFCKSPACLIHCEGSGESLGWYISCTKCFCELGYNQTWTDVSIGEFKTEEEAKAAWNQRQTT